MQERIFSFTVFRKVIFAVGNFHGVRSYPMTPGLPAASAKFRKVLFVREEMVWLDIRGELACAQGPLDRDVLDMFVEEHLLLMKRHTVLLCSLEKGRLSTARCLYLPCPYGRWYIQPCVHGQWVIVPTGMGHAYALSESKTVKFEAPGNLAIKVRQGLIAIAGGEALSYYSVRANEPSAPP